MNTIRINGELMQTNARELSFHEIVFLAFPTNREGKAYSVRWAVGGSRARFGTELARDQRVPVVDGVVFDVEVEG